MSGNNKPQSAEVVDSLLADAVARQRLVDALAQDLSSARQGGWARWRPFLAGLSSASVVLLAFLLPAVQDQWDRYRSRAAVDRYVQIGRELMHQGHYESAEAAFGRALELSGNQRLDVIEDQTRARVMRVYDDPHWRGQVDDSLNEADFVYLLALESTPEQVRSRSATLTAYGAFLAGKNRWPQAEQVLKEAVSLQPESADPHIHLGNLYDDVGRQADAEQEYRRAIALNPKEANAQYDLGLLLVELGRQSEAADAFSKALTLHPTDTETRLSLIEALKASGRQEEAVAVAEAGIKIDPARQELQVALAHLRHPTAHKP